MYAVWVALPALIVARVAAAGLRPAGLFEGQGGTGLLKGDASPGLLSSDASPGLLKGDASPGRASPGPPRREPKSSPGASPSPSPAMLRPRAASPASARTAKKRTGGAGDGAE